MTDSEFNPTNDIDRMKLVYIQLEKLEKEKNKLETEAKERHQKEMIESTCNSIKVYH